MDLQTLTCTPISRTNQRRWQLQFHCDPSSPQMRTGGFVLPAAVLSGSVSPGPVPMRYGRNGASVRRPSPGAGRPVVARRAVAAQCRMRAQTASHSLEQLQLQVLALPTPMKCHHLKQKELVLWTQLVVKLLALLDLDVPPWCCYCLPAVGHHWPWRQTSF